MHVHFSCIDVGTLLSLSALKKSTCEDSDLLASKMCVLGGLLIVGSKAWYSNALSALVVSCSETPLGSEELV